MSILTAKQVDLSVEADPLDSLLRARVPLRTLLSHGVHGLDWLNDNPDLAFHLSYRDELGVLCHEQVDSVGLLERAHRLGFEPWPAGEGECLAFYNSHVWDELSSDGDLLAVWYSRDSDECTVEDTSIPLTLPPELLAAVLQAERAASEQLQERLQAEQDAKAAAAAETTRRGREYLIWVQISRAQKRGETITREQAIARFESWIQELSERPNVSPELLDGLVESFADSAIPQEEQA